MTRKEIVRELRNEQAKMCRVQHTFEKETGFKVCKVARTGTGWIVMATDGTFHKIEE